MSETTLRNDFYDSDSFISDDQDQNNMRKKMTSQPVNKIKRDKDTKQIYTASTKGQRNSNKKLLNRQFHPVNLEFNSQRLLSARNHKINDQSNAIHQLSLQIDELKNENKTLKTQFYRQEKALNKIDIKQTDFPKILEQHEAEVLNLKELLRRSKDNLTIETKQRKEGDTEILKLRDNLTRANQLIAEKNLDERSSLQSQINDLQTKLESREKCAETSSKHIEYLEKTHKREIYSLKKQIQKGLIQYQDLENELELTRNNLKEKEKLLEIQNIYSYRFKNLQKTTNSSGPQSEQLLDKLDFNSLSQKTEEKNKKETDLSSKISTEPRNDRIDTGRIKDDIRKIVAEEILSGRIKPFEICVQSSDDYIVDKSPSNGRSTSQDYDNTDRVEELEPSTQVQSLVDDVMEPKPDPELLERERNQRNLILDKLNELAIGNDQEEMTNSSTLMYSYPRDTDYLGNEGPISEIESIHAANIQHTPHLYKFSSTVDSLHNGVPVHQTNINRGSNKQTKPLMSSGNGHKKSQIDALHNQRNNSNLEVTSEDILPQLNADDKKRKESQLLSELFGGDFTPQPVVHGRPYPSGSRQSRAGSLPWQNEHESRKNIVFIDEIRSPNNSSVALSQSEDIEQIVL